MTALKKCRFGLFVGERVYEIVGFIHRLSVKPAPEMVCRGGFYKQYLMLASNSYKPAPTQPII
jgi:hypothetical protein